MVYHDTTHTAAKPTFGAGSISITGTADYYNAAGYKTAYSNTVYKFKYKQDRKNADGTEGNSCGFKITLNNASNVHKYAGGILVESNQYGLFMELYNTTNNSAAFKTETAKNGFNLASDTEYEIEFGMYAISATEVRIIVKVDGAEIFNVVTDDESFRTATGYFGIYCTETKTVTVSGMQAVEAV